MSSGYLLDTNVVSDLARAAPDARVVAFVAARGDVWLSAVAVHELEYGLRLLPGGRRRRAQEAARTAIMAERGTRVLPLDRRAAEQAAELQARSQQAGRPLGLADALIAGTAEAHDLAVATRNVADFEHLDVGVLNPWQAP